MKLGTHEGAWYKAEDIKLRFRQMDEQGEMQTATVANIDEGSYLEMDGVWFQVFLSDSTHNRYFLEVVS